ncbi:activating transcription factor 4 [Phyllostomus discolor]|uniref:Activating transcription factor 4 n=1 Tax=Phyllostomus discolor TaxID=89673 RepID=A0A834ATH5_9CHIR|nr:activating transcription factor 4 [Phyllostomus discolor]
MTEMSFLSSEVLVGDFVSPFDQSGLGAEESLGLLDDSLEVAKHFKPHGFSSDKAKAGSSEWLAVDGLVGASDNGKEDAFSGTDWMVEKMDLNEFDFDALLGLDDLEMTPDEFWATLEDSCGLLDPLNQEINKEPPQTVNPIGHLPESLPKTDQVASFTVLQPRPLSPVALSSTLDHSFSLELGCLRQRQRHMHEPRVGPGLPSAQSLCPRGLPKQFAVLRRCLWLCAPQTL